MRLKLIWTILASGTILANAPSHAQTYDPNYPVCIQITEWGGTHIDCSFTSMPQCQATASNHGLWLRQSIFPASPRSRQAERIGGANFAVCLGRS